MLSTRGHPLAAATRPAGHHHHHHHHPRQSPLTSPWRPSLPTSHVCKALQGSRRGRLEKQIRKDCASLILSTYKDVVVWCLSPAVKWATSLIAFLRWAATECRIVHFDIRRAGRAAHQRLRGLCRGQQAARQDVREGGYMLCYPV